MKLRILEICKQAGITQKELAERIGLSAVGLSKAINGILPKILWRKSPVP